jgi:Icc-related predicted phosphoesterase
LFDSPEEAQRADGEAWVRGLDACGVPAFYIMGNDDLVELAHRSEAVRSLHGRRLEYGGFGLVGYQYSLPFMGGTFEKPDEDIEADLTALEALMDERTVFVSHSPARGILDAGVEGPPIGSRAIRQFLETRPFLAHVHGHCHVAFGRQGKHFNVASAGCRRAMIIDLETMRHTVAQDNETGLGR